MRTPKMCSSSFFHVILSVILIFSHLPKIDSQCASNQFPIGTSGTSGAIQYLAMDVISSGPLIVMGGSCLDSGICGAATGRPIIELVDGSSGQNLFTWSKYLPERASAPNFNYESVTAVKFRPDGSKVAAVFNTENNKQLAFIIVQVSTGTLLDVVYWSTAMQSSDTLIRHQGLLFDNDDNILVTYTDWDSYHAMKLPKRTAASVVTSWVLKIDYATNTWGRAYAIQFDHETTPTGYITSGHYQQDTSNSYGTYLTHLSFDGSRSWNIVPNPINYNENSYISTKVYSGSNYLWTCGLQYTNNIAMFTKIKINGATNPNPADWKVTAQQNTLDCLSIEGQTDQVAFALVVQYSGGKAQVQIAKITFGGTTTVYTYTGLQSMFFYSGSTVTTGKFIDGSLYFAGTTPQVENGGTFSQLSGYVMKFTSTEGATFDSETCTSFTLTFPTTDVKLATVNFGVTIQSNSDFVFGPSRTFNAGPADLALVNTGTSGLQRMTCKANSNMIQLTDQSYDYGSLVGTTTYQFPDFDTFLCLSTTYTYSVTYSPSQGDITFISPSRTFAWSAAATVNVYTVTVKGTLPNTNSYTNSFIITITNACAAATVSNPASQTLNYLISDLVATTATIGTFTPSVATCALTYSLEFSNGTVITVHPIISLAGTTLTIGPSTDNSQAGTYSILVKATLTLGSNFGVQSFTVNLKDQCLTATVSPLTAHTFTYQIMTATQLNGITPFTISQPAGASCFTFTLYKSDQATIVNPVPSYITYTTTSQTLQLGPSSAGDIGTAATLMHNYYIKAVSTADPLVQAWQTLTLNIEHECTTASFTSNPSGESFSYTLMSASKSSTISSFQLTQAVTGASCFTFNLYLSDQITLVVLPSYISFDNQFTLTFGPSVAWQIHPNPSIVYNWYIRGEKTSSLSYQFVPLKVTVYHECYNAQLINPVSSTYSYTSLQPQSTYTMSSFTISQATASVNCFTFSFKDGNNPYSEPFLSLTYPTLKLGQSTVGDINYKTQTLPVTLEAQQILDGSLYYAPVTFTFYHECYTFALSNPPPTTVTYTIFDPTLTFSVPQFTASAACKVNYELYFPDGSLYSEADPYFNFDDTTFKFSVTTQSTPNLAGSHVFTLKAAVDMGIQTASTKVTVNVKCEVKGINPSLKDVLLPSQIMPEIQYHIGSGEMRQMFNQFETIQQCGTKIVYEFSLENGSQMPWYIKGYQSLYNDGGQFVINLPSRKGIFQTQITVKITGTTNAQVPATGLTFSNYILIPIQLLITNQGPPSFDSPLISPIELKVSEIYPIRLPKLIDPDTDDKPIIDNIEFGLAQQFIVGQYPNFIIQPTDNQTHAGTFVINITLRDNNPIKMKSYYSFILNIEHARRPKGVPKPPKDIELKARIKSINRFGLVTCEFITPINVPDVLNKSCLEVRVIPGIESKIKYLQLVHWDLLSITEKEMKVQLKFENPQRVSHISYSVDILQMSLKLKYFQLKSRQLQNEDYENDSEQQQLSIEGDLPRQVPNDGKNIYLYEFKSIAMTDILTKSGPAIKGALNTMIYSNLAINLGMQAYKELLYAYRSQYVQMIWGVINVMQLIAILPLVNVQFPYNAATFFSFINEVASLNPIPTDSVKDKVFNFTQGRENPDNFQLMGYDSNSIIDSQDTFFADIMWYLGACGVALGLKLCSKYQWSLFNFLDECDGCNLYVVLRFTLQIQWSTQSDQESSAIAFVIIVILSIIPFAIWLFLWLKQQKLPEYHDKLDSTYSDLRLESKSALLYNVMQMLRRQVLCNTIMFLQDNSGLQIQILLFNSISVLIYNILASPFEYRNLNRMELFNELCVLIATIHLVLFSDIVLEPELQYMSGWGLILLVLLNIIVNFIPILVQTFYTLRQLIRIINYKLCTKSKAPISSQDFYPIDTNNFESSGPLSLLQTQQTLHPLRALFEGNIPNIFKDEEMPPTVDQEGKVLLYQTPTRVKVQIVPQIQREQDKQNNGENKTQEEKKKQVQEIVLNHKAKVRKYLDMVVSGHRIIKKTL